MGKAGHSRQARMRRHRRVRRKVTGTSDRPRLNVYRSLRHIYAQIIDDSVGSTLVSSSTMDRDVWGVCEGMKKTETAGVVGRVLAERALANGVAEVVFDRGGCKYHGRVKALAEAAREGGLTF